MKKISDGLSILIGYLLLVFITLLVVFTFIQILSRFVFKISIAWSEEIIRMNFVWMIFLGGAIAVKEKSHLVMDMLTSNLKNRTKTIFDIGILFVMLSIYIVLLIAGIAYCMRSLSKTAVTIPIPANIVYSAAPISAVLGIFFVIERLVGEFNLLLGKGESI